MRASLFASKLPELGYGAPGLATFRDTYNSSLSEIPDIFARSKQRGQNAGTRTAAARQQGSDIRAGISIAYTGYNAGSH